MVRVYSQAGQGNFDSLGGIFGGNSQVGGDSSTTFIPLAYHKHTILLHPSTHSSSPRNQQEPWKRMGCFICSLSLLLRRVLVANT